MPDLTLQAGLSHPAGAPEGLPPRGASLNSRAPTQVTLPALPAGGSESRLLDSVSHFLTSSQFATCQSLCAFLGDVLSFVSTVLLFIMFKNVCDTIF